jgi:hypothetical protein
LRQSTELTQLFARIETKTSLYEEGKRGYNLSRNLVRYVKKERKKQSKGVLPFFLFSCTKLKEKILALMDFSKSHGFSVVLLTLQCG